MTRREFLNNLYRRLENLSREQAEQHLTYYAEMLADRMEEGMSEEEAVASMEDVETIALRILQDEGVPPQYPEPPAVEKRTPAEEKPRDWRRPAAVALCALMLLVTGGMAFNRISKWRSTDTPTASDGVEVVEDVPPVDQVDSGISIGPDGIQVGGLYVGPDGIQIDGEGWDAADWAGWAEEWSDSFAGGDYAFAGNSGSVPVDGIEKIEVEWLAGDVEILSGGSEIAFTEMAVRELEAKDQLVYKVDGDTLTIKFWEGRHSSREQNMKLLTLTVPDGLLEKLKVETVSADVSFSGLELKELEVNTVSGDVGLYTFSGKELEVHTVSGDMSVYPLVVREVEAGSTSGDIFLDLGDSAPAEISLNTISGDMTLATGEALGFRLEFETVSGELYIPDFEASQPLREKKYIRGDGSCEIDAESTSGDLTVMY